MRRIGAVAFALLVLARPAGAWNGFGHRVIAAIAYHQIGPELRERVVGLLGSHPAAADPGFWAAHEHNGPDRGLNALMNASIFPDDARSEGPFHAYHIGRAHYVNWRIRADLDGRVEEPATDADAADDLHRDLLTSLATNVAVVRDGSATDRDRAVALSWIAHQVGDLHQPLHTVARFTPELPGGDRGGNEVRVPGGNLHGYWDNVLGRDESPPVVEALARALESEHPRDSFETELAVAADDFRSIGLEGVGLATGLVYRDLDPAFGRFEELPVGYAADAEKAARRRVALAGYRLADLLRSMLGDR